MPNIETDIVALLAADIASPRVVAAIDAAIEANEQVRVELMALRRMAVRRHGGAEAPAEASATTKRLLLVGGQTLATPKAPEETHPPSISIAALAISYQTDKDSPYLGKVYSTRQHYDTLLRKMTAGYGDVRIADMDGRTVLLMHEEWGGGGKVAMSHAMVGMLRTLANFGATILKDEQCERLAGMLAKMRFKIPKPRTELLTEEHVKAIINKAHEIGRHSLALAQAFQFDCILRQKDVIGEWVPKSEPGVSDVMYGGRKWRKGIRWSNIDGNLLLRHIARKQATEIKVDLRGAPLIMKELELVKSLRNLQELPVSGPLIVNEQTGLPWQPANFRAAWREIARACRVPDSVKNMDSRASEHDSFSSNGPALPDVMDLRGVAPRQGFEVDEDD